MKEVGAQLLAIWKGIKPLHKGVTVGVIVCISLALGYAVSKSATRDSGKAVTVDDEIVVDSSAAIQKGFELFDTNTWIKGERELQVLEMRALKGQLERDLAQFDQIKSASVILDMSSGRSFGATQYKTKGSVILSLAPGAHLSVSQMQAITYHLAGAVHGLEPNMIAISDTTGRLYKALDPEGEGELLPNASLAFEVHVEQKIAAFLATVVGEEHYFCSVQASMDTQTQQLSSFSVAVTIDSDYAHLDSEIENQLNMIAAGYEAPFQLAVNAVPFEKKKGIWIETKKKGEYGRLILTALFVIAALASIYPLFRKYAKKRKEDSLFKVMTRIDIDKLAESVQHEDPKTIALMLSYLEPARAEQLISSFPKELQEQVLHNLSEMEYDNN